jgi:hypothetical protein
MTDFCPFMSSGEKKVACDPDCNLYMRENNGLKNPWNGKPFLGCAITKNLYMTTKLQQDISSLQQDISSLKISYTRVDGSNVVGLSTIDRNIGQAMGRDSGGNPLLEVWDKRGIR